MRGYGEPASAFSKDIRIGLHLAQEELGQLLGASRQRVNQALKAMERRGIIRVDPAGLVICDLDGLQREAQSTAED
jgi:DNA-binding GntR family transcriptional regulator